MRKNSRLYCISARFNVSARYLLCKYNSYTWCVDSMGLFKKLIVVFLLATALPGSATFVCSAQSGTDENTKPLFNDSGSLYGNEPNFTGGLGNNVGTGDLFFRMILMVLLVVVLGAAAIYLSKKLLPRFTQLSGKRIRVVETVHLGPRKTVYLLKIGSQQLLIGSTNENITKLADITDESSEVDFPANQIDDN